MDQSYWWHPPLLPLSEIGISEDLSFSNRMNDIFKTDVKVLLLKGGHFISKSWQVRFFSFILEHLTHSRRSLYGIEVPSFLFRNRSAMFVVPPFVLFHIFGSTLFIYLHNIFSSIIIVLSISIMSNFTIEWNINYLLVDWLTLRRIKS